MYSRPNVQGLPSGFDIMYIWLWRIEICAQVRFGLKVGWESWLIKRHLTYDPLIWLKVTSLSSTASKRKGVKNQENSEFLMIQPTLSDQNFGARVDGKIKLSNFLMKWGWRGHWGYWGCWGCWGQGFSCQEITQYVKCMAFFFIFRGQRGWWGHWGQCTAVMLSCLLSFLRPLKFGYSSKTSDEFTSQIKPLIFVTDWQNSPKVVFRTFSIPSFHVRLTSRK